jgi:prepilin-type N-terminal cleavage/methylation domain-containing protein
MIPKRHASRFFAEAFSLVELLVVVAIVGILMALLIPALGSIKGAGALSKASSDLADTFEQARAYAMSQNTYVYVGLQEVDALSPTSADGIGRVVVAAVASKTGLRPTNFLTDAVAISRAQALDGAHMTNVSLLGSTGNMLRPVSGTAVDLSQSTAATSYQFSWPLGGTPSYSFKKVLEFDPQGCARVPTNATAPTFQSYIELGLVPARGNSATVSANQAVIQINGITGAPRLFRP